MNYSKSKTNNPLIEDLSLENIFISEFLPDAPGDFVKIYLYARYLSEQQENMADKSLAEQLGVTEERLTEAWEYWESWGAIRKKYLDEEGRILSGIEFLNLKEQIFGQAEELDFDVLDSSERTYSEDVSSGIMSEESEEEKSPFENEDAKALMPELEKRIGKPLSISDMQRVVGWVKDKNISRDIILFAADYSAERGKGNFNYIASLVEGWTSQELRDVASVKEYIEKFDDKFKRYKRVLQALGLNRNATEEEKRIMDTWFDEMNFNMERVLEACAKTAGINNPNIKYVNSILTNWKEEAVRDNRDPNTKQRVTNGVLTEYYSYIKEQAEREAEERRKELYSALPEVEEMDKALGRLGVKLGKALIAKDRNAMKEANLEMERLNEDRAILLAENDFDINYTDPRYRCTKCNDTGIAEMGGLCDCRNQRRVEAELWLREREDAGIK